MTSLMTSDCLPNGGRWAAHLQRLGLRNYLVGAMDGEALPKH